MLLTSLAGFTEESTRQCRELVGFWRRRQEIEQEYGVALAELCQSYHKNAWDGLRPHTYTPLYPTPGSPEAVRSQLLSMRLWTDVWESADQLHLLAEGHIQVASQLQRTVIDPMQGHIREMESMRKAHLEQGRALTRQLQDTYTEYRRAKQEYDTAQASASEMIDSLSKAQLRQEKKRDLEKLQAKASGAIERVTVSAEALRRCEDKKVNAQQVFYEQMMPALDKEVRAYEEKRLNLIRKGMLDMTTLDVADIDARGAILRNVQVMLSEAEVVQDMAIFEKYHLGNQEERMDVSTVSVRSLVNPLKAGRVYVKRGDTVNGWATNYFVVMNDGLLYCFDGEDSEQPVEVVSLNRGQIWSIDDSYFGRANCFQLILDLTPVLEDGQGRGIPISVSSSNMTGLTTIAAQQSQGQYPPMSPQSGGQQSSLPLPVQRITYNIIAESGNDKHEWISTLRKFCVCCSKCQAAYGLSSMTASLGALNISPPVRSIRLWVMEAKELKSPNANNKSISSYCVVLFNDVKQARTGIKVDESPFWGEEFRFNDIPPCRSRLRLLFFNAATAKMQRDTEIGYVSINLSTLKPNRKFEEWYQIRPFNTRSSSPQLSHPEPVGAVRIAYILSNDQSLPMALYEEFIQIILEPSYTVFRCLGTWLPAAREELAKTMLNILLAHERDDEGVISLTRHEIESTEDPNIIFRGNSVATKILDQYMKLLGQDYLHLTLTSLIRGVYTSKESCEVDPSRLQPGKESEQLKRNWKRLLNHVTIFWEAIQRSAEACPPELVTVFADMRKTAGDRFIDPQIKYAAVSGFIFLRFFCPAILSPKLFGIMNDHPDAATARTLTLIAKILQNLANLTEFEGKEPHMSPCNTWIASRVEDMRNYIEQISTVPDRPRQTRYPKPRVDLRREAAVMHHCISERWAEVKKNIEAMAASQNEDSEKLQKLVPIMEKLKVAAHEQMSTVEGLRDRSDSLDAAGAANLRRSDNKSDAEIREGSLSHTSPRQGIIGPIVLGTTGAPHRRTASSETGAVPPMMPQTDSAQSSFSRLHASINPTTLFGSFRGSGTALSVVANGVPGLNDHSTSPSAVRASVRKSKNLVGNDLVRGASNVSSGVGAGTGFAARDPVAASPAAGQGTTVFPYSMQDGLLTTAIAAMDQDEDEDFVLAPMSPLNNLGAAVSAPNQASTTDQQIVHGDLPVQKLQQGVFVGNQAHEKDASSSSTVRRRLSWSRVLGGGRREGSLSNQSRDIDQSASSTHGSHSKGPSVDHLNHAVSAPRLSIGPLSLPAGMHSGNGGSKSSLRSKMSKTPSAPGIAAVSTDQKGFPANSSLDGSSDFAESSSQQKTAQSQPELMASPTRRQPPAVPPPPLPTSSFHALSVLTAAAMPGNSLGHATSSPSLTSTKVERRAAPPSPPPVGPDPYVYQNQVILQQPAQHQQPHKKSFNLFSRHNKVGTTLRNMLSGNHSGAISQSPLSIPTNTFPESSLKKDKEKSKSRSTDALRSHTQSMTGTSKQSIRKKERGGSESSAAGGSESTTEPAYASSMGAVSFLGGGDSLSKIGSYKASPGASNTVSRNPTNLFRRSFQAGSTPGNEIGSRRGTALGTPRAVHEEQFLGQADSGDEDLIISEGGNDLGESTRHAAEERRRVPMPMSLPTGGFLRGM
ncbi:hypothetical protein DFS34DRAFT_653256 [Phlyctochytrium arcticum]|nr:hypothetical protein DFS34DRAFT_653256 [Phlyctochytrium arcticum]